MVEARTGTIFTAPILATIFRATEAVDRLPGVNHDQVTSVAHRMTRWARVRPGGMIASEPIMLRPPTGDAEAAEIRRLVLQSYAFGSMVSIDEHAALIRAGFDERRLDYRRLFDAVNATVLSLADERVAVYVSGQPRLNGWILRLESQVLAAFAVAIVLTWVLLYAYFRDWRGALRPTISGGLAALWGFGLMRLTGFALNPLTLVIPFLITARAVSHSAQMHDRYYEELARGRPKSDAIGSSFVGLFAPTMAGILTDAEYNQSHRAVQGAFGGSEPFMVVAEGDERDALQRVGVLRTIESFQRALERTAVVGASFSLVDILKSMGQLFHELEPRWAVIPEEERAIRTMFFTYWGSVFPSTSTQYFTPDFATAPITFYCRDHTVEHVRALVAAAREFIA